MMGLLTHALVGGLCFAGGYLWCLRTWSEWEPKKHPMPKEKP
jgi:hypothetical protein